MHIDPGIASLILAMFVQAVGVIWWASSLNSEVKALKEWKSDHDDLRERMARMEQSMHDARNSLQRIENRLSAAVAAE